MKLSRVIITNYKSIDDSTVVEIDDKITVLVGQNESGKTAFLEAINKCRAIDGSEFEYINDYPRKSLNDYEEDHESNPGNVAVLTYCADEELVSKINEALFEGQKILSSFEFSVTHKYNNTRSVDVIFGDDIYLKFLKDKYKSLEILLSIIDKSKTIKMLIKNITDDENAKSDAGCAKILYDLNGLFEKTPEKWGAVNYYIWHSHLEPEIPSFLYFDDYKLLPGKINLQALDTRKGKGQLTDGDKCVLGLLELARVEVSGLLNPSGYEKSKARLEGISNKITDKVFEFWKQNQEIEVEFDVRADPADIGELANGLNLYIRIFNRRHRVSVPFDQRSKGFIWFFSFLVWFESVQKQTGTDSQLILLLDEPGLSLHALAQNDFLDYIDTLSKKHQIIYTTHSPFMIRSDRLNQVRVVEDRLKSGTIVTDSIAGSSDKTVFPLQAALGYTIAQNLFISSNNLLVEGPADLIYLQYFSNLLCRSGRACLAEQITIVPVGGLDKIATFVSLLGANDLNIVVLHDYTAEGKQKASTLVKEKIIKDKLILNYAMYRAPRDGHLIDTDVEDFFTDDLYIKLFNEAFLKRLDGQLASVSDLPQGDRIIVRLNRWLVSKEISLRAKGGFNHYAVASFLATHSVASEDIGEETLEKYEKMFTDINRLFNVK